ncbi:hypothetical protein Acr_00g0003640 [Actinidia rufa]|uniref:Reverse transcriptase domain-containing protein n=1 Tax=Actinidia rufa TaxID=165716 RepID=A0A7J0D788_9ERIC|nr:hypothetical protein Acr_00g0003640 [Actinidia rufa]
MGKNKNNKGVSYEDVAALKNGMAGAAPSFSKLLDASSKPALLALAAPNVPCEEKGQKHVETGTNAVTTESESMADCSEEESALAASEETSRTLGEEDSDSTQDVCKNAPEKVESNKRRNGAANPTPTNPWATKSAINLFAGNRIPENGLKLQQIEVGNEPLKFEEENVPKDDWNHCLMGYFSGRFPGKKAIQQLVLSWKEKVSLHYHSSGWIVFKFDNLEGRDNTLQGGPYMVFGRPLLLKILPDYFSFKYEELSCFPVWVQFKNLPLELWCEYALSRLGSKIGKPMFADKLTARRERISYARVLVEVDVAKPITQEIHIILPNGDSVQQEVFYENLPLFCTHCKTISHSTKSCKVLEKFAATRNKVQQAIVSATDSENVIQPSSSAAEKSKDIQLEWVTKKPRASNIQPSNKVINKAPEPSSMNKFSLLESLPEAEGEQSQTIEIAPTDLQIQELPKQQQVQVGGDINAEQAKQLARGEEHKRRQQQPPNPSGGPSDALKKNTKQIAKSVLSNTAAVSIAKPVISNTAAVSIAKPVISNTAATSIAKPAISNIATTSLIKTKTVASSSNPIPLMAKGEEGRKKRDKQKLGKSDKVSFAELCADLGGDSPIPNISFIYAFNSIVGRRPLWDSLYNFNVSLELPWLLLGDFNNVLKGEERVNGRPVNSYETRDFRNCCYDLGISDLRSNGVFHTWTNNSIWCKLDRAMVNTKWIQDGLTAQANFGLAGKHSDHSPCTVSLFGEIDRGGSSFKFFNMWTQHENFLELVSGSWNIDVEGTAMYRLCKKLKALKEPLKAMNRQNFSHIAARAEAAETELLQAQQKLHDNPGDIILQSTVPDLRRKAIKLAEAELSFCSQLAKAKYLKNSDKGTKFFHDMIKSNQAKNQIISLIKSDGTATTSANQISSLFVDYYKDLLGNKSDCPRMGMELLAAGPLVQEDQKQQLTRPVLDEEIKSAIFGIGDDKAPGPDGYTACFFKKAWTIVGNDVCAAVKEFFRSGKILKQINHATIVLAPKSDNASKVEDFRPIACCNVIYKIISKILASRLSNILEDLIDPAQSAFVPNRSMTENIYLVQELLRKYCWNRISPRCIMKIDLRKAYDTINWVFLEDMLSVLGFPDIFINWIMQCVTTAAYSISINGTLHGFFKGQQGIRQGDPLSPFLFTICMEFLSRKLRDLQRNPEYKHHPKCAELNITHLAFADDTFNFQLLATRGAMSILSVEFILQRAWAAGAYVVVAIPSLPTVPSVPLRQPMLILFEHYGSLSVVTAFVFRILFPAWKLGAARPRAGFL